MVGKQLGSVLFMGALMAAIFTVSAVEPSQAAEPTSSPKSPSKFKDFAEVTKDAKKIEGLFDLYQDNDHLYAVLKGGDFNQSFLAPMSIARGAASAGTALNFGEQWVVSFKRVGDRVHLIRKNLRYEAPKGTPLEKAVEQNYTDSVLMALPIVSDNAPGGGVLIDFGDIFFTNFANLPIGGLDRSRSSWHKVKGYPKNVEMQVMVTFAGGSMGRSVSHGGDSGTIDSRGTTMVLHYSLVKMPDSGYRPRFADQRVGHFLSATKDFGSDDPDTQFVRRINRWHLEKADANADLSPPKKQIVWWVEDTVPHEYRPFVEEGILEWNKAFEKIGFRNALSVRWQNDRDEFDPEDVNYCTFRWITTPMTFAMSNLRSNPITGEMIDGDVIFDASWIRFWKQNHAYLVGSRGSDDKDDDAVVAVGEIISPMMAARYGYGLPESQRRMLQGTAPNHTHGEKRTMDVLPESFGSFQAALNEQAAANGCCAACQYSNSMQDQYRMAAIALAGRPEAKSNGEPPDELIGQVIKSIVMHEVGHSLGLRHNFRASAMLDLDQVHDKTITREKGLVGSVMDYTPVNIALKGQKQGDYATTTLGPYDYWAIEYAYKPISGSEKDELTKIAARSPDEGLEYATDEDLYMSNDPRVNVYDLGSDTLEYAKQRIELSNEVVQEMEKNLVKDGESWARLRPAFLTVLNQYGDAAYMAMQYVGGREISRDARGEKSRDPISPVSGKKQRDALKFIAQKILVDEPIPMRPELLRRVTTEHWYHWGADMEMYQGKVGIPYYAQVEAIQNIPLAEAFGSAARLQLIESNEAMVDPKEKPLQTAEVFRTFTDAIWTDLQEAKQAEDGDEAAELNLTKVRRNLQRRHLQYLVDIVLGPKGYGGTSMAYAMFTGSGEPFPAEARSLARQHLKEIHALVKATLENEELELDELTQAHLDELNDQLQKVLDARVQSRGV